MHKRQKYAYAWLSDLWNCAFAWFSFINISHYETEGGSCGGPWKLNALQLKKTHVNRQNTRKWRTQCHQIGISGHLGCHQLESHQRGGRISCNLLLLVSNDLSLSAGCTYFASLRLICSQRCALIMYEQQCLLMFQTNTMIWSTPV